MFGKKIYECLVVLRNVLGHSRPVFAVISLCSEAKDKMNSKEINNSSSSFLSMFQLSSDFLYGGQIADSGRELGQVTLEWNVEMNENVYRGNNFLVTKQGTKSF
jgi:hypothetical protein